jgi:hypothetical protein
LIHLAQLPTLQGDLTMSDESTNPGEKPVNDGGTTAPQPEPDPTEEALAEKPANDGGGS